MNITPINRPANNMPIINNVLTMSSYEIAELVQSNHSDVRRSIERLGNRGVISLPPLAEVKIQRERREEKIGVYNLCKRDSLIVVAQLCPEFTARIVDRWQELENQANVVDITTALSDPNKLRTALLAYTEKVIELEAKVEEQAPKAEFHDAVTDAINCQSIQEVAKVLGTGPNRLFKFLRDEGILKEDNLPYQQHVDAGHFRVVERQYNDRHGESHIYTRTLVTGKGLTFIQKRIKKLNSNQLVA